LIMLIRRFLLCRIIETRSSNDCMGRVGIEKRLRMHQREKERERKREYVKERRREREREKERVQSRQLK